VTTGYITWNWNGEAIRVGFDRLGEGPTVLLLPVTLQAEMNWHRVTCCHPSAFAVQ
jgi:hypothetical protein